MPALPLIIGTGHPKHDTLYAFQGFSYLYSALTRHGEWPTWIPYLAFGQTVTLYDLYAAGPGQYLAALTGWLLGAADEVLLFALGLAVTHFILLAGLVLLAREIGLTPLTAGGLCAVVSLFANPLIQIDFNYLIYAPLPLLFWFILRFLTTGAPLMLAAAALYVVGAVLFGRVTYTIVPILYVAGFWALLQIFLQGDWSEFKPFTASRRDWALSVVLVLAALVLVLVFLVQAWDVTTNHTVRAPGRDGNAGRIDLHTFLTYGANDGLGKYLTLASDHVVAHAFSLFIGRVFVASAILGAVFAADLDPRWRRHFIACLVTAVAVMLVTAPAETDIARYLYGLPGWDRVRHLGLFGPIAKLLILICGAVGLSVVTTRRRAVALAGLVLLLCFIRQDQSTWLTAALAFLIAAVPLRHLTLVAVLVALPELALHYRDHAFGPAVAAADAAAFRAAALDNGFPLRVPAESSTRLATYAHATGPHIARYGLEASFLREDYCRPSSRQDLLANGPDRLTVVLASAKADAGMLRHIAGCGGVKLRFVERIIPAATTEAAEAAMRRLIAGREMADVVEGETPAGVVAPPTDGRRIEVLRFAPNELLLRVAHEGTAPALLLYTDASHPWWGATLDNKPAHLLNANLAFKAVAIPPGEHMLSFRIAPSVRAGAWVKAGMLAALALGLLVATAAAVARTMQHR